MSANSRKSTFSDTLAIQEDIGHYCIIKMSQHFVKVCAIRLISLSVDNIRLELNLLSIKTNIDESFSMKIIKICINDSERNLNTYLTMISTMKKKKYLSFIWTDICLRK